MAINTLLSAAHLLREIGDGPFAALVSSSNTKAVREFAENLLKAALPTEMTVGGRSYDILEEVSNLYGGREDREHLLKCEAEIPIALRGKVVFVFKGEHPDNPVNEVWYVYWDGYCWAERQRFIDSHWASRGLWRVLRPK